jgi:tRNA(Ile)-lysidine synthase
MPSVPTSWIELGINPELPQIIAVSGGPDSMALLHILHSFGFKKLIVAHVDHGIRLDSYHDAHLVAIFTESLHRDFFLKQVNVTKLAEERNENLEAVGRDERYSFFRKLQAEHQAQYIVTAHHADDQVETVLMNIVRGCGLNGLTGMAGLEGDLWRPLLHFSKQELLQYCREHHISYVNESTNQDLTYRRNYLRHQVVPQLKKLNPNLLGTMQKNIHVWKQAQEELEARARAFLTEHKEKENRYSIRPFLDKSEMEQQMILRELHQDVHGHKMNLVQEHLDQVLKILRQKVSGKRKEFGPGMLLVRRRDWFEVVAHEEL